ncbi:hypothetical protein [Methylotuvimicrobium sp. KM2]|uniref:hypothetical protein n=1 Tax=Methylotuvimicrobium sp. KM2 TaxID=3133976 RepID=UPI003100B5EC
MNKSLTPRETSDLKSRIHWLKQTITRAEQALSQNEIDPRTLVSIRVDCERLTTVCNSTYRMIGEVQL